MLKFAFGKALVVSGALLLSFNVMATGTQCERKDFTLQLLGSGGPISDDQRASSGELIWWKGKARILIDAGGGVYLRYGQSGAKLEDLHLMALTHFHTDHTADVPAILKGAYFIKDKQNLVIAGPEGGNGFPSMTDYFSALFNAKDGAYAYLSGLYNATDGLQIGATLKDIDYRRQQSVVVYEEEGLKVTALGIPHGDVPCVAYRIDTTEGTIVISADQNGSNDAFIPFAKGADILVMPAAIDEHADEQSRFMHATPSVIGKIAAKVQPKKLVLNHFMGKSLILKNDTINIVKKYYHGDIYASRDLSCFPVSISTSGEIK